MSTITKVTPVVMEIDEEARGLIGDCSECHEVPFGCPRVDAFHEGALLREACAQYFEANNSDPRGRTNPEYKGKGGALWHMLFNVVPQGLLQCYGRNKYHPEGGVPEKDQLFGEEYGFGVKVLILLDYPLTETWGAEVVIPANRFGEVFAIAHDMYRHIYDLDDSDWQSKGHQDSVPRLDNALGKKMLNRARGEHVWGHDMSDLVFEWMNFLPNPVWPMEERERMRFIDISAPDAKAQMKAAPEVMKRHARVDKEIHAEDPPFLGTVTFFVGS